MPALWACWWREVLFCHCTPVRTQVLPLELFMKWVVYGNHMFFYQYLCFDLYFEGDECNVSNKINRVCKKTSTL